MSRSQKLKEYYAIQAHKKSASAAQKKAWQAPGNEERRSKARSHALKQGKNSKIIQKRKKSFAALPVVTCSVCGIKAKKHAMTRHTAMCGKVCSVKWCKDEAYMKSWCFHHYRLSQYAKHHKVLPQELFSIIKKSKGKCQICQKTLVLHGMEKVNGKNKACIDHSHKTGKIRGILCFNCNSGLGHFSDSLETMKTAITYLRQSEKVK